MEEKIYDMVDYAEGVRIEMSDIYFPAAAFNSFYGVVRNEPIRKVVKRNVGLMIASTIFVLVRRKVDKSKRLS